MANATSHRLLARLQRDLAELRGEPYPGVDVFIDDADMRKFCLVLTPPGGPWKGLALHFDVVLPASWPSQPPSVTSSVHGIDHPNLFGAYICCDILKPAEALQIGYTGGYTPALTLRGLFLQFLTFFSSTSIEQDYGNAPVEIGDVVIYNYLYEKDVAFTQNYRDYDLQCHAGSYQPELKKKWETDSRLETTVIVYQSPGGPVTHKVKGAEPHPNRIHRFDKRNPRWQSTYDLISQWSCRKCPYGSPDLPQKVSDGVGITMQDAVDVPANALLHPPSACALHILNDDILLETATYMQSETLITLGHAYPRFHKLIADYHILLLREVQCFFLKTPLNQGILGVGVSYDPLKRTLSSDFDWLSLEAFTDHHVRKSIEKREFGFFLPLAFNRVHFNRAKTEIWKRVTMLDTAVRHADLNRPNGGGRGRGYGRGRGRGAPPVHVVAAPPRAQPHQVFNVLYKMMNNIVVSLMKSCDDALDSPQARHSATRPNLLGASEKAVISYCHLIHLLCCVCRVQPAVLQEATQRVKSFLLTPASRTKTHTQDMGELIVAITLVLIMTPPNQKDGPRWTMLNGPFLEEAMIRNVRWVLKDSPELEVMEEGANDYRLATTFRRSKTSLRLIMFQVTFLNMFIKTYHALGIQALDQNYGFPEDDLPPKMVEEIKEIYKVETWPAFFAKVNYEQAVSGFTKEKFTGMLRDAVKTSGQRRYHDTAKLSVMDHLRPIRRGLERAWMEAQTRK